MSEQAPNITDWIGSIGTAAAFLVAAISFAYDRFRRRLEAESAQARLCDAWISEFQIVPDNSNAQKPRFDIQYEVSVSNVSNFSIRGTTVIVQFLGHAPEPMYFGVVPPNGSRGPTTRARSIKLDMDFSMAELPDVLKAMANFTFEFTDASRKFWHRTNNDDLEHLARAMAEEVARNEDFDASEAAT